MSSEDATGGPSLSPAQQERLESYRSAQTLSDLQRITGADSEHEAYLLAKDDWRTLREAELQQDDPEEVPDTGGQVSPRGGTGGQPTDDDNLPGDTVTIGETAFHVHGITHADTDAERSYLRSHVERILDGGGSVYCEQGIRPMYFQDLDPVNEVDDYAWAMQRCRDLGLDSHVGDHLEGDFPDSIGSDLRSVASQFRDVTFSLIESGSDVYGDRFGAVLGDIASDFLLSHEEMATGDDYTAFRKLREAATDPAALPQLQDYYRRAFLPQPLEREWLRRHDRELELFTHGRNERLAGYVLFHAPADVRDVHLVTGVAHQPGVVYYLSAYRDGVWTYEPFDRIS